MFPRDTLRIAEERQNDLLRQAEKERMAQLAIQHAYSARRPLLRIVGRGLWRAELPERELPPFTKEPA